MTTGNEAGLDLCDFIGYFMEDETVGTAVIYTEHIKRPKAFLEVAQKARALGKTIVMMHPGKSAKGAAAFQSHTGALAGDYDIMEAFVRSQDVVLVESLDELIDTMVTLSHYPNPAKGGLGVTALGDVYQPTNDECALDGLLQASGSQYFDEDTGPCDQAVLGVQAFASTQ